MASCCQHPGWPPYIATWWISMLLHAAGCDGTGMETNAKVWVLHSNFMAWLEKKSPPWCSFTPLLASSVIYYTAIPLTLPCDTRMMTWQYYGANHNFLSLLWTSWPCSTPAHNTPYSSQSGGDDLAAPGLGTWEGRDRFLILPFCPLSW